MTTPGNLNLGDEWHGLVLDHPELLATVNALRFWFNTNARKWSRGQVGGNALIIAGAYGTGKSHMANVVRQLVGRGNCVYWEEPELVNVLWDSYKQGSKSVESRIYREARQAPLLILDDIGAAHINSQGWMENFYWKLFSYDPLNGRGGILATTNLPWSTSQNTTPFARRVGQRALTRIMHGLDGPDPDRNRPLNWHDMWDVRDRRFDPKGLFEESEGEQK